MISSANFRKYASNAVWKIFSEMTRSSKRVFTSIDSVSGRESPENVKESASNVKVHFSASPRASRIFALRSFLPTASAAFASADICGQPFFTVLSEAPGVSSPLMAKVSGPSMIILKLPRSPTFSSPSFVSEKYHSQVRKSRPGVGSALGRPLKDTSGRSISLFLKNFIISSRIFTGIGSISIARRNSATIRSNAFSDDDPTYRILFAMSTTSGIALMVGGIFIRFRSIASSLIRFFSFFGTTIVSFACMYASSSRRQIAFSSCDGIFRSALRRLTYRCPPKIAVS